MNLLRVNTNRTTSIVIQDHMIRYLKLKQASPLTIQKTGEKMIPDGVIQEGKIIDKTQFIKLLQSCIKDWKLKRNNIQFIVPDALVVIRKISVPANVPDEEIRSYLYLEIGTSIHLPFEDPVFDIHFLGNKDMEKEYLLFAAPEQTVIEYSQLLESVKLKPVSADVSSLAFYRLLYQLDKVVEKEHLLCIHLDLLSANCSIFHRHKPLFMRHIPFDYSFSSWKSDIDVYGRRKYVWKEDVESMRLKLDEALTEIERIINFYRFSIADSEQPVDRIIITGEHPHTKQLYEMLKTNVDIPVESFLDDEEIQLPRGATLPSSFYVALGLSLKEV